MFINKIIRNIYSIKYNIYDLINYIKFYKMRKNNKKFNTSKIDYNNIINSEIVIKNKFEIIIYNNKIFNNYIGLYKYKKKKCKDKKLENLNSYVDIYNIKKFLNSRIILIPNYKIIDNYFNYYKNKYYCIYNFYIVDMDDFFIYVKKENDIIQKIEIFFILILYILIYLLLFYKIIQKIILII